MADIKREPDPDPVAKQTSDTACATEWPRMKRWWKWYLDAVRHEQTEEEKGDSQTFGF